MTDASMATRLSAFRSLPAEFTSALKDFQSSNAKFRILKTVQPTNTAPQSPSIPSYDESPKTIFILDSSFNPPSIAHRYMAQSALRRTSSDQFPKPHRLLLLFATMNADKAPSAASFDQRLTLMCIFAKDLISSLQSHADIFSVVPVDIGVTTVPYYTDKSAAIESEGSEFYPAKPKHIHLVGFDTLTRFFAAKYYQKFNPPFSALNPYFDAGHRLRVSMRPDDDYGDSDYQKNFLNGIEGGKLEAEGAKREWVKQIDLVEPNPEGGVSSTKIRKAAKRGDWEELSQLTTPNVTAWVRSEGLYAEDDVGAKMA